MQCVPAPAHRTDTATLHPASSAWSDTAAGWQPLSCWRKVAPEPERQRDEAAASPDAPSGCGAACRCSKVTQRYQSSARQTKTCQLGWWSARTRSSCACQPTANRTCCLVSRGARSQRRSLHSGEQQGGGNACGGA
eukprot:6684467-Prymnesium_polylepis.1